MWASGNIKGVTIHVNVAISSRAPLEHHKFLVIKFPLISKSIDNKCNKKDARL